ncbi:MAG: peptide ABC transporter substrate-binding protein [Clostridia bacterium]|nr:peptide ABC transporter substrate-binding protein [Clostridia bacterium]
MSKRIKVLLVAAMVGLAMLFAAACGGGGDVGDTPDGAEDGDGSPQYGGTLNVALSSDAPRLDPGLSSSVYDRYVFQSIFDKLADIDENGEVVPVLAKNWDVSDDGLTYTFHLQEGVKFHDGTDFNAEAVKFNFDRNTDPASPRRGELAAVKEVTVVDEYTVEVVLSEPFAPFLSILTDRAGMMVSPTAVEELGEDFANSPVGTGPFKFESLMKGNNITLVKNEDYWQDGLPYLDSIVFKIITDTNVTATNLKSGQVDISDWRFPTKEIANFENDDNFVIVNEASQNYNGFYLNISKPPFDNKHARQALDVLMDREALVDLVKDGAATVAHSYFSPGCFAHGDSDIPPEPSVEKAKEILAEGGLEDGFTFTYKTAATPEQQQIAEMLQSMFKEAGITMNIEQIEFGTLLDQTIKGEFEAAALGWSGRPDPDQNIFDDVFTDGSMNYSRFSHPEIDELVTAARKELDQDKRKALYDDAMEILVDELPYIFTYHENNVICHSKNVHGFTYISDGLIRTAEIWKD